MADGNLLGSVFDDIDNGSFKPDQPAPAVNPLLSDAVDEVVAQQKQPQAMAAIQAKDADPEQYQKLNDLAQKTGLDTGFVARNLPDLQQQQKVKDLTDTMQANPALGEWFAQGDNAQAIKVDELRGISGLSWLGRSAVDAFESGMDQTEFGTLTNKMLLKNASPEEVARADELSNAMQPRTYAADSWMQNAWVQGIQQLPVLGGTLAHSVLGFAKGFVGGAAVGAGYGLVAGAGTPAEAITVPGAAVAMGTFTGRAGAVADAYLYSFEQQAGPAYYEFKNMKDENGQPMDDDVARAAAVVSGSIGGALEMVGEAKLASLIPGASKLTGLFSKDAVRQALMVPTVRSALKSFAVEGLSAGATEVTTEVAQQAVQIFAQEAAKHVANLSDGNNFEGIEAGDVAQQLLDTAKQTAQAMTILGPALSGTHLGGELKRASAASRDQAIIKGVMDHAQGDELLKRLPAKAQEAVAAMTKDGPVQNIYMAPEAVTTLFQNVEDQQQFIDAVGIRDEYEEASRLGRDMQIPIEVYYAKIAGTDAAEHLAQFSKVDPQSMTPLEAQNFNDAWAEAQQSLLEQHEDATAVNRTVSTGVDAISDDVKQKAMDAGIVPDQAQQYSKLYGNFFRVMAERTGQDPYALYNQYGFDIKRALPGGTYNEVGGVDLSLAAIRSGRIPSIRRSVEKARGLSLIDRIKQRGGIDDEGGNLATMNVPKGVARKGTSGQASMLAGGDNQFSADDTARQLWEEGYFPQFEERPSPNDLYDAIAAETAGDKIYSAHNQLAPEVQQQAELVAFHDMLDELGLDPQRMDDEEIKAALDRATNSDATSGAMFQRTEATKTKAFKKWFGDSKVVDENGDPLKVFHGSASDIEAFDPSLTADGGLWFTADPEFTTLYSARDGGNVTPVYLSLQNPASVENFSYIMKKPSLLGRVRGDRPTLDRVLSPEERTAKMDDIKAKGHDGIIDTAMNTFVAFEPSQVKSVNNQGSFNSADPRILYQDMQGKRGSIQLSDGRTVINLFDSANLSTFLHESGHFFLEVFRDVAMADERFSPGRFSIPEGLELVDKGDGLHKIIRHTNVETTTEADPVDGSMGTQGVTFYEDGGKIIIAGSYLPSSARGKGLGLSMYKAIADFAQSQGKVLESDFDVSPDAVKVYDKLLAAGYDVEKSANFRDGADSGYSGKFIGGQDEEGNRTDGFTVRIKPKKTSSLAADWQATKDYLGITGDDIPVEAHEKFARTFEAYLFEGKAPSGEVAGIFARFRSWLTFVYASVKNLNVPINDKIRGVMDRLLATDTEIKNARTAPEFTPRFTDATTAAEAGMSETQFATYQVLAGKAVDAAKRELDARMLNDVARETTAEWKAAKREIRDEATANLSAQPVYKALAYLRTGAWNEIDENGDPAPPPAERFFLDRDATVKLMGEGVLERLPKGVPPLYRAKGGVHPDFLAEMFGFQNGSDMLIQMMSVPPIGRAIAEDVNVRMKQRFGDLMGDAVARAREATAAMANDDTGKLIAAEMEVVVRKGLVSTKLRVQDAKRIARETIRNKPIRDAVRQKLYMAASSKAAKEANVALVKQDWTGAVKAMQRQLVNHYMALEANEARVDTEKAVSFLQRYASDKRPAGVDAEYVDQIQALIERFDLRKSVTLKETQRRASLAAFIQAQEEQGNLVQIPDALRNDAFRKPYREMTVEDIMGLRDTAQNIEHLGRLKDKLMANKEAREFGLVRDEIVASIEASQAEKAAPDTRNPTTWDKTASTLQSAVMSMVKMEQAFSWMDGGDINGPLSRNIFRPIAAAEAKELDMQVQYTGKFMDILGKLDKQRLSERLTIDGVQQTMSRAEIMSVALNMGNAGNLDKMMRAEVWDRATIDRIVSNLNPGEAHAVQEILDTVNSLWPEIEKLQKRLTGVAPAKVEAQKFMINGEEFAGGYYPLIYDPNRSPDVEDRNAANADKMFENTYLRPETAHGFTKERSQAYARPLLFDLDAAGAHVISVIHDLTHREAIMDANKLLTNPGVRASIEGRYGKELYRQITPWLQRIANDRRPNDGLSGINAVLKGIRSRATMVGMGFRFSTILTQIVGLSPTLEMVPAKFVAGAMKDFIVSPLKMSAEVNALSGEMRHRATNLDRDIRDQIRQLSDKTSLADQARRFAFTGIGYMDRVVSVPTWMAGYAEHLSKYPADKEGAIAYADQVVRLSQSSGGAKDLASIQSNSEATKLITMFYSYFSAYFNRQYTWGRDAKRAIQAGEYGAFPDLLARQVFMTIIPAVAADLIVGKGPDKDESYAEWMAKKIALYPLMALPMVRDVAGSIDSGFGYTFTPASQSVKETVLDPVHLIGKAIDGKAEAREVVTQTITTAAYALKLPLGQLSSTINNVWKAIEEDDFQLRDLVVSRKHKH